ANCDASGAEPSGRALLAPEDDPDAGGAEGRETIADDLQGIGTAPDHHLGPLGAPAPEVARECLGDVRRQMARAVQPAARAADADGDDGNVLFHVAHPTRRGLRVGVAAMSIP